MKDFANKIAVITGAGSGMGRELARRLATEGCHLALCDIMPDGLAETQRLCTSDAAGTVKISGHLVDVSLEADILRFQAEVAREHRTEAIHLLFNNAGIGGGGSFVRASREKWDKTFAVCWGGVYYGTRAFLPMLLAADEGHIVNTSSMCGFWAARGEMEPQTAYSSAKFAVKGFTEALLVDLRINAPHIRCSVVMPGHIGTDIQKNSRKVLANRFDNAFTPAELASARARLAAADPANVALSDDEIRQYLSRSSDQFHDDAPMSAAEAAVIILDGVRRGEWRILVGEDAKWLDELVRLDPEHAYEEAFQERRRAGRLQPRN